MYELSQAAAQGATLSSTVPWVTAFRLFVSCTNGWTPIASFKTEIFVFDEEKEGEMGRARMALT